MLRTLRKGWTSKMTCRLGVLYTYMRHSITHVGAYTNVNVNVNVNCVNIDSLFLSPFFLPPSRSPSRPGPYPRPSVPLLRVVVASFPFSVPSPVSILLRSICTYFILYRSCPLSTFLNPSPSHHSKTHAYLYVLIIHSSVHSD